MQHPSSVLLPVGYGTNAVVSRLLKFLYIRSTPMGFLLWACIFDGIRDCGIRLVQVKFANKFDIRLRMV